MVPLTKNRVRINIGTKRLPAEPENQPDFIKKNTIVIEVADDNSLTVEPYDPEEMEVETVDVKVAHPGDNAYALYNNGSTRQLRPSVYAISIDSKQVVGPKYGKQYAYR